MKIILNGANGQMGQMLRSLIAKSQDCELAAGVDISGGDDCYTRLGDYTGDADCVLDFSHHSATKELIDYCVERHLPVIAATTGQTDEEREYIRSSADKIPVFFSATMSPAVAMLTQMAAQAARLMPEADIEIIERHHNRKLDVPSGTALLFARAIQEARPESRLVIGRHENGRRQPEDIGIHSLRMGNEFGTHTIILSTASQTVTFEHRAESRQLFAEGALNAVRFIVGKPAGLYDMFDLVKAQ